MLIFSAANRPIGFAAVCEYRMIQIIVVGEYDLEIDFSSLRRYDVKSVPKTKWPPEK